ncbi:MAG: DUF4258 domain-containing protein [Calditrichota bacterium]
MTDDSKKDLIEFWRGPDWNWALTNGRYTWQAHAIGRMAERGFHRAAVLEALFDIDCIESYPEDTPFPSALFLGWEDDRPMHVVASFDCAEKSIYIITVYEPDLIRFQTGFRKRRAK